MIPGFGAPLLSMNSPNLSLLQDRIKYEDYDVKKSCFRTYIYTFNETLTLVKLQVMLGHKCQKEMQTITIDFTDNKHPQNNGS